MASFLLPSSIQKRLLRYALSRLELLDTDALDLEHLEISWGTRSTLEFRDVGLQLKKLTALLNLPPRIDLAKARILLLRITIPVDIYSSPIVVEVDGVVAQVRILSDTDTSKAIPKPPTNHDRERKRQEDKSKKHTWSHSQPSINKTYSDALENEDSILPTATDLARSFLQTEPPEEKAELEATLSSQSQNLTESIAYSDDGEDEAAMGTGTGLALPAFMANFLKGILDRLQVHIHGVILDVDVDVSSEGLGRPDASPSTETVTVQLKVDDVGIEGVTFNGIGVSEVNTKNKPNQNEIHKDGKRRISLHKLRGALISDPSLFASMARSSALSSPSVTYSALSEARSRHSNPSSNTRSSSLGSTGKEQALRGADPAAEHAIDGLETLESSVVASDSGRFDDAVEEDGGPVARGALSIDTASDPGNSFFNQSVYLDQVTDSQFTEDDGDYEDNGPPFALSSAQSGQRPSTLGRRSPLSTPRASVYMPPPNDPPQSYYNYSRSRPPAVQPPAQSTVMPVRLRPSFSEWTSSRSPLLLRPEEPVQGNDISGTSVDVSSSQEILREEDDSGESDGSTPLGEDLAQSMIFSHEDAESMYMSALSQNSAFEKIPGAWNSSLSASAKSASLPASPTTERSQLDSPDNLRHAIRTVISSKNPESPLTLSETASPLASILLSSEPEADDATTILARDQQDKSPVSDQQTAPASSTQSSVSSDEYAKVAKQIFHLDYVTMYLPSAASYSISDPEPDAQSTISTSLYGGQSVMAQSLSPKVPGAFSAHVPQQRERHPRQNIKPHTDTNVHRNENTQSTEISIGRLDVQFDVSIGRLMTRLVTCVVDAMANDALAPEGNPHTQDVPAESKYAVQFRAERISVKFLERLAPTGTSTAVDMANSAWVKPPSQDVLLRTTIKGLEINHNVQGFDRKSAITLQKLMLGYAKESIVSFDAGLRMRSSTRDLPSTVGVDLTINITRSPSGSHFKISSLPIHVSIDLQRLDETFSWFGGLSSVLNMGSSMASNATVTLTSPTKPPPKPRLVRFEAPIRAEEASLAQNKVEARIGGFVLDLVGKECTVGMDTTAVKVVGREEGIGLSIDKIKISGPHLHRFNKVPAILAELNATRVEFVASPKTDDIDRLLRLVTPSKAKYDRDDDILLDTLLKQRRQGSVLRVTVASFKTQVKDLEDLKYLPELGEELSKLSSVAKYLPDDDRPGLLTLLLVRDVDLQVALSRNLGSFQLHAADFEAAQITFPALVALSIESVTMHHNQKTELVGAATAIELREPKHRSPAIMARMIGDEMEPIVKVKLWNLRLEYSVPIFMTILGLSERPTAEEVVEGITSSVATLTELSRPGVLRSPNGESKPSKDSKGFESKAMTIDIGLRECILALNPLGLPSRVLVVITEGHLSAVLPKDNNSSATFDMNKGSLLVIDDANNILPAGTVRMRRKSFDGGSPQVADLCSAGFVAVSSFSSARVIVQISTSDGEGEKSVDIELRDDLLVLESCADSTQTFIAALNALKPPTPPSQEIKYRTKVIPVQDLLASLSGDAFGTAEGNYDFDEDFGPGLAKATEGGGEDDDENVELAFDSHYYQEDDSMDSQENGDYEESRAGSVLFDQLEIRDTSDGVLLESFREQEQVNVQQELEFHEDHFGTGSILEGTAHRWNSAKNIYDRSNDFKARKGPLRVSVRDVHIIWNLFDGYDWQHTRDAISKAVQDVQSKAIEQRARNDRRSTFDQDIAEEETVIGDFLFNSIYIGIPANRDPRELANAINQGLNDDVTETESVTTTTLSASPSRQGNTPRARGKKLRLHRSKHHKITFELKGVNVDLVSFPPGSGETESSMDIRIHDFDIFDHVPTSTWKKFATYMHDAGERESGTSQIHLEILNVKPIPELEASEIVLKASVLPLRLHVDQDALDFITRFFEFKDDSTPVSASGGDVPFLQRVEVNSIPVKLDFKPKRVDYAGLRSGHTTEFMNFLVLDEADMVLRHTIIYGISGFDKLGKCLNDIWMPDIKRNQLPGILAGLAPVRSLANVGGGMRDLVVIPMREYRKDGRIVRSISKGAISFARTTGTELVKLGAKLAIGTQTVLQGAEDFLSKPGTPSSPSAAAIGWDDDALDDEEQQKQISAYADQPIGVVQGLRGGYASLERDLLMARDAIIAVPGEVMESGTAQGAVGAVLRRAPTVILRPVMGVTKALGQTLMGATNSLDPQNMRRVEDKYKKH